MALSNEQLLMLDILIYTNYVSDNATVQEIINRMEADDFEGMKNDKGMYPCEMTKSEWQGLVNSIKEEPKLLEYIVTEYDTKYKRVACFVDSKEKPTDVNVIFKGTDSKYKWHDNGEGGYLIETNLQAWAANYVEKLPDTYGKSITVSGHSKGGNEAQYVTILTDRIGKCVSYDGQGFSKEFLEEYPDKIALRSQKITSISASNDYVNCLLYSVAGTTIYIETENQNNPLHYHKPNILLDDNGKLREQTKQSYISKVINEYSTYLISNLEEPERSQTIDGLIDVVISAVGYGDNSLKEAVIKNADAELNVISHIDDCVFNYIENRYGQAAELIITYRATVICPILFLDDLLGCVKEMAVSAVNEMLNYAERICQKLQTFGQKASEYAKKFVSAISIYAKKVSDWFDKKFNYGYQYATNNTYIRVNTCIMREYYNRLNNVNKRIVKLDKRMDTLYTKVGLFDLWDLIQADVLTGYSWRISRCMDYLINTAEEFETVEYSVSSQL